MTPDRWNQISQMYEAARARPERDRAAFLDKACAGDASLQHEVQALLDQPTSPAALEGLTPAAIAQAMGTVASPLLTGRRFGVYRVEERIGAGGMAEVYRARDTRLGRDVAIKVLPPEFANDAGRLARFEREARVLAALDHPHIGAIHGVEESDASADSGPAVKALVLALVEGDTLAERIARGPLPIADAISYARQIADALEAAHDKGIVHRDLKPANIKVTPAGVVKVLDFGLAKVDELPPGETLAATVPANATRSGMVLGTPAYMSPEQARGQSVDKRADVWAFGCVVYEMLTGRAAFAGDTVSDTIAAILGGDVNWKLLPEATPASVHRLLRRCLVRESARRLRDIADATLDLDEAITAPPVAPPETATSRAVRPGWIAAGLLSVTAVLLGTGIWVRSPSTEARAYRSEILMPAGFESAPGRFALSPDGRRLAVTARDASGKALLWVRSLDEPAARPLPGTDGAEHPFWSPDSRMIAYYSNRKLKKVAAAGGASFTLCDAGVFAQGGTWNHNNTILFTFGAGPLFRVSADGGTPQQVTTLDREARETGHAFPFFLPDGRHFLYTAYSTDRTVADRGQFVGGVYIDSLDPTGRTQLLDFISHAEYAGGHVLFIRDAALIAQRLDLTRMKTTGESEVLAAQVNVLVPVAPIGAFSVSEEGVLAFEVPSPADNSPLVWVDRHGRRLGTLGSPGHYGNKVQLSPDGTRALAHRSEPDAAPHLVVLDASGVERRLTSDPAIDAMPVWSPDGTRVAFSRRSQGPYAMYVVPSSGAGAEEILISGDVNTFAESWSPDGRFLLYVANSDLWVLPMFGERKPFPFRVTPAVEWEAQFSPDGRWVAYSAFESGRYEVYVSPFSATNRTAGAAPAKWLVSSGAGQAPRWRPDGKEIFYWSPDTRKLMAVPVRADGLRFEVGRTEPLFDARPQLESYPFTFYDVSTDGQRFLVSGIDTKGVPASIALIVNWPVLLKN